MRNDIIEQCALVVDQCNHEGPYNAIGAASRIRALKDIEPRWRHKKRGTTYTVVGRGKLQISDETIWRKNHGGEGLDIIARTLESMDFVIYRADSDGSLWARPAVEFDDGRFEPV